MTSSGEFFICGVITACTDIVFFPTDIGTSGAFRIVVYNVMTERNYLLVGGIVTACAGLVSFPALFGASRCLRLVMNQIVTERADRLGLAAEFISADCAVSSPRTASSS